MSLTAKPYDQENIYDLTIRLYGNINGLSGVINSVTSVSNNVTNDVTYDPIVFEDYVSKSTPIARRETLNVVVGESQSIFDLAVQLTGSLKGMNEVISKYRNLDQNLKGQEIEITKSNDPRVDIFLRNQFVFATKSDVLPWILETGAWNDFGIWNDTANWID